MPNYDPNGNEWPLEMCKVKEAWELTLPPHGEGKNKGEGIAIAHPDTGWTKHPELLKGDRYLTDYPLSKNFFGKFSDYQKAEDDLTGLHPSHGTTTASLMLSEVGHPSTDPPSEFPDYDIPVSNFVSGIAPKVEVIPQRVTNFVVLGTALSGSQTVNTYATLTKAVYHALSLNINLVGVISISLGGLGSPKYLETALKKARQKGVIVIAAAGQVPHYRARNLSLLKGPAYPSTSFHTISAAGCDENFDTKMKDKEGRSFNIGFYGHQIEITTPGYGVNVAETENSSKPYKIINSNGTSYSTALTAGACALWQAYHGRTQLIKKYGRPLLTDVFRICLANSSEIPAGQTGFNRTGGLVGDFPELLRHDNRGNGVLNAEKLLKHPLPTFEKAKEVAEYNQWKEENWGDPSDWGRE